MKTKKLTLLVSPMYSKGIQDSMDSRFQVLDPGVLDNGNWIPGFNCLRDSVFLELNYRLQCPGFRIPPALKNFVDSGKSGLP